MRYIAVDGNDGLGKTSLVNLLIEAQLGLIFDRSEMTKWTDDPTVNPIDRYHYFLLDGEPELSQKLLLKAGRSIEEKYHTLSDLRHYRSKFLEAVPKFNAEILEVKENSTFRHALEIFQSIWNKDTSKYGIVDSCNLKGVLYKPLIIACPTGKLFNASAKFLKDNLLIDVEAQKDSRVFFKKQSEKGIYTFLSKPKAIPELVASDRAEIGLVGSDTWKESEFYNELESIGTFSTKTISLSLAGLTSSNIEDFNIPVIATEYPETVYRFFAERQKAVSIIRTWGSTEGYCPVYANFIVDLVDSGKSLEAQNLIQKALIAPVTLDIIVKKSKKDSPVARLFKAAATSFIKPNTL